MRRKAIIPVLLLLLFAACPGKVNTDALNEQIVAANSDYDSVSVFVTSQLAALKLIVDNGGTLSDAEKQRAIDLYDVLTLLDEYRNTIAQLTIDPTADLLTHAVDTWDEIYTKAKVLGWEDSNEPGN